MSNFLCLDLGTKTGFCVFLKEAEEIRCLKSGTINFSPPKNAPAGRRFLSFKNWLQTILKEYKINAVYYEQVFAHSSIAASHVYGGFLFIMMLVCDEFNINCNGIGVCTIKKNMTGDGHASKQGVIEAVGKHGFNPIDDNEADAIAIMFSAIRLLREEGKHE